MTSWTSLSCKASQRRSVVKLPATRSNSAHLGRLRSEHRVALAAVRFDTALRAGAGPPAVEERIPYTRRSIDDFSPVPHDGVDDDDETLLYPPGWAIVERDIEAEGIVVAAHVAPSVRPTICNTLGYGSGLEMEAQFVRGLRNLGFDFVFDTLFAADDTVNEEGRSLLSRLRCKVNAESCDTGAPPTPTLTSCYPGWRSLVERFSPDLLPHASSCSAPRILEGSSLKAILSERLGVPKANIRIVSIVPDPASAGGASEGGAGGGDGEERIDESGEGFDVQTATYDFASDTLSKMAPKMGDFSAGFTIDLGATDDADHTLTTADVAKALQAKGIDLRVLPHSAFDTPLDHHDAGKPGKSSAGGIAAAAARECYKLITGCHLEELEFKAVEGLDAVKTATVAMTPADGCLLAEELRAAGATGPIHLRVAVARGLQSARHVAAAVREGSLDVDFVEVVAPAGTKRRYKVHHMPVGEGSATLLHHSN